MSVGVDGKAAPAAVGPAGSDDSIGVVAERRGLAAGDVQADVTVVALDGLTLLVELADLLELHDEPVGRRS